MLPSKARSLLMILAVTSTGLVAYPTWQRPAAAPPFDPATQGLREPTGEVALPSDPKVRVKWEHAISELYVHYVDCLDSGGGEEQCYDSWNRECESLFGMECPLEEMFFPEREPGDEAC
jgi:hypothetical protein